MKFYDYKRNDDQYIYCHGYDTYIAYIYDDNLIINKFENNNKLKLVD